jgi:putative redox protein
MKARIKWIEDVAFVGESGSGHAIVLDGAADAGGRNLGVRPMEAVLIGMGTCAAYDVVTILRKGRNNLTDCEVHLEATRADEIPKVFTTVHMRFVVSGKELKDAAVNRAVSLSAEKYCSATAMIEKTAKVTFDYEVRDLPA